MSLARIDSRSSLASVSAKMSRLTMPISNLSHLRLPILPPQRHKSSYAALAPAHYQYADQDEEESQPLCADWIFTSASNAHIAIDRKAFKKYTPFESYVLTVADKRHLSVRGVGSVELKIRKSAKREESNTVLLENVLHVPEWTCNLFSDIFFDNGRYDYLWTRDGVVFWERKQAAVSQSKRKASEPTEWGYTEEFFGLEKLVVVEHNTTRSIMTEEHQANGKEVWCVNLMWPAGQRIKWETSGQKN